MINFHRVFAIRHVLDRVLPIFVAYGEIRMIDDASVCKHPGMHLATEAKKNFGRRKAESDIRSAGHLSAVLFFITWRSRRWMNVVHHRIGILHHDFLAGLNPEDIGLILATPLIYHCGRSRSAGGLATDAFKRDKSVAKSAVRAYDIKPRFDRPGVQFSAICIIFYLGYFLFGWWSAFQRYSARDIPRVNGLEQSYSGKNKKRANLVNHKNGT